MPCQSWGEDDVRTVVDPKTKQDLDKYKRAFCEMSEAFRSANPVRFNEVLKENAFLNNINTEHSNEDSARWFKAYSKAYPSFTREEIAKMVRAGILDRV